MLASVFALFTFCYVTRTLYDIFIAPTLGFAQLFSGVCLPLLWDFVPIFLMFAYHFQNLKILKKDQTKKRNRMSGDISSNLNFSSDTPQSEIHTKNLTSSLTSADSESFGSPYRLHAKSSLVRQAEMMMLNNH